MQRTSQAIAFIQNSKGFLVFPYIDHFGGGEKDKIQADGALLSLQLREGSSSMNVLSRGSTKEVLNSSTMAPAC